jgi:hypothetical protein
MKWKKNAKPELYLCFKCNNERSVISLEDFMVTKFSDIFSGWQLHMWFGYTSVSKTSSVRFLVSELWQWSQVSETLAIWTTDVAVVQGDFTEWKIEARQSTHSTHMPLHASTDSEVTSYKPFVCKLLISIHLRLTYDIRHINYIQENQKWI